MTGPNFSAIRVRLRYESIEDFMQGYTRFISKGGMFIPMSPAKLKPVGTTIRFQFLLQDGTTALLGEGVVRQIQGANSGDDSSVGILVKFTRLNRQSKELVEQILVRKRQAAGGAETSGAPQDLDATPTPEVFAPDDTPAAPATPSVDLTYDELHQPETEAPQEEFEDLFLSSQDDEDEADGVSLGASGSDVFSDAHVVPDSQEAHGPSDAPDLSTAPESTSPQHLGRTEAGLQIMAFDRVSEDEAAGLADFDFGTDEGDIDQMFDDVFGDGGFFGGPGVAPQDDAFDLGNAFDLGAPDAHPEPLGAVANDGGEPFDLGDETDGDAQDAASDEFQVAALDDDDLLSEDFGFDLDDSAPSYESIAEEDVHLEDEALLEEDELLDDQALLEEDEILDDQALLEDEVLLEDDFVEDNAFETSDAFEEPEEAPEAFEEEVDLGVRSDDFAPEYNAAPSDDLISVLGSLDSDEEPPRRGLTLGSAAQLAAVREDEEEDSLAALLALAQQDIDAKREAEGEDADANPDGDIFDQLLGIDDLPPPPKNQPIFDITDSEPKKKGGFMSKLFGKD